MPNCIHVGQFWGMIAPPAPYLPAPVVQHLCAKCWRFSNINQSINQFRFTYSALLVTLCLPFYIYVGFCDYPTYYNTDSDECVLTCPSGTIGNVSRNADVIMRNCTSRE